MGPPGHVAWASSTYLNVVGLASRNIDLSRLNLSGDLHDSHEAGEEGKGRHEACHCTRWSGPSACKSGYRAGLAQFV
jgi:hypothetical protein